VRRVLALERTCRLCRRWRRWWRLSCVIVHFECKQVSEGRICPKQVCQWEGSIAFKLYWLVYELMGVSAEMTVGAYSQPTGVLSEILREPTGKLSL